MKKKAPNIIVYKMENASDKIAAQMNDIFIEMIRRKIYYYDFTQQERNDIIDGLIKKLKT